jgi:alpha-mannosidase
MSRILALAATCTLTAASLAQSTREKTLYYIPHTHWEGAVFQTREGYLETDLSNLLQALRLLEQYPEYKFALDQVAYFKPLLERYPEQAEKFRRFVAEGRLEIVGGMDVMPDVVKPGGELFVRQMQYGKRFCRDELGVEVTVAWLLDTFGHHPQMPQLLRRAGFESFWFCRGVPRDEMPSEFRWRGIDGTEIPAFWLPGFYGLFYGPPREPTAFAQFFEERFGWLDPHATGNERVGLAGVDVSEPEDYVPPLVTQFNQRADAPFTIRYSVPSEFAALVARRTDSTVVTDPLSPIFQGTYSSRIELKQATRRIEQRLLTAEKLTALASCLGAPAVEDAALWRAWEPLLFNQTHDLASGVMTDAVYEDTVRGYDYSERLAADRIEAMWSSVAARIDTRGEGTPIVVFNPLGWERTDLAEVELGFTSPGVRGVRLLDPLGHEAAVQFLYVERYGDQGLRRVRMAFVAHDVPAVGYSTYRALALDAAPSAGQEWTEEGGRDSIENEHYRVSFDLTTGAMTSLVEKSLAWEVLAGPANVVAREEDHGDLWELDRGLDGASHIAMTAEQPVPKQGAVPFSSDYQDANGIVRRGPVLSEFTISHPFDTGRFRTRVRLIAGLPRIDIETELVNHEKHVRYRVLFPTTIPAGRYVSEIPFGAIERPAGIEFPAQHWVDTSDGEHGIAVLNRGLPGNLESGGTLMLSLLRSHNLGAYGFGGGYEPGMSSEGGFELGVRRTFEYALVPHAGDWEKAGVYRAGLEFNHPLLVRKTSVHEGVLPARWGWLEVSAPNVVLTALGPGPGKSTVLRVYEASGRATPAVRIALHARVTSAHVANLLGDPERSLEVENDSVKLDLHPFEIQTILVELEPARR